MKDAYQKYVRGKGEPEDGLHISRKEFHAREKTKKTKGIGKRAEIAARMKKTKGY